MENLTEILTWLDSVLTFPQMSFLRPILASVFLLVAVDLTYKFVFSFFKRFFE